MIMNSKTTRGIKRVTGSITFHAAALILGFLMLYPILWMISNSFKTNLEIFNSFSLVPSSFNFDSYIRGWKYNNSLSFGVFFKNSFVYTSIATVGAVLASACVAYGFARIHFWGSKVLYGIMFLTLMLPYQVIMVPQFIIFQKIGWVNTLLPLIVPQFGGQAFFIFLMVQFIRGIPKELDQSAMIDGCSKFSIFIRIIFPLIAPALITSTIFSFYWRWDDFLGPLLYLNSPRNFTVSMALRMFSDPATSTDWGAIFAMGTLSLIPVFLLFIIFQKYIVQGMVTSGLKG
ncbi:ABC transporter permease [Spirochaetia bacterium]|nr:ABC transporter permease [Spirochaetia bacterium]